MSRPVIPGYLEHPGEGSLGDLWTRPAGVPAPLWPTEILRTVDSNPTDWVTVAEHFATDTERSGTSCVLVKAADTSSALAGTTWIGDHLGQVGIVDDETFEDGLVSTADGLAVEFFAHVRQPSGVTDLSTWDAFESVVIRLTTSLTALTGLMVDGLNRPDPSTDSGATD